MEDLWKVPDVTTGHRTAKRVVPRHKHKLKLRGGQNEKIICCGPGTGLYPDSERRNHLGFWCCNKTSQSSSLS